MISQSKMGSEEGDSEQGMCDEGKGGSRSPQQGQATLPQGEWDAAEDTLAPVSGLLKPAGL